MLEWELGWPLCWWQMKVKQTQLACLQLQWFSRAGSSKDMLFVDKTHSTKLWKGAETVSQCNHLPVLPAPLEIPASCAGSAWRCHHGAQFLLGQVRRDAPWGAVSTWQAAQGKSQCATCRCDVHVYVHPVVVNVVSHVCPRPSVHTINIHTHRCVCVHVHAWKCCARREGTKSPGVQGSWLVLSEF